MNEKLHVESTIHFKRKNRGEKVIRAGESPPEPPGRVPRISRMMALAIWFDELIRSGAVKNFAELARLGHVSRTQMSHVMNLLLLAPAIQEELLFLPRILVGPDSIHLKELQPLTKEMNWERQVAAGIINDGSSRQANFRPAAKHLVNHDAKIATLHGGQRLHRGEAG